MESSRRQDGERQVSSFKFQVRNSKGQGHIGVMLDAAHWSWDLGLWSLVLELGAWNLELETLNSAPGNQHQIFSFAVVSVGSQTQTSFREQAVQKTAQLIFVSFAHQPG